MPAARHVIKALFGERLPLNEPLKDSRLGIPVLRGRSLRAFEPVDHVLHCNSSFRNWTSDRFLVGQDSRLIARPISSFQLPGHCRNRVKVLFNQKSSILP